MIYHWIISSLNDKRNSVPPVDMQLEGKGVDISNCHHGKNPFFGY
jgi:hypothetical protein